MNVMNEVTDYWRKSELGNSVVSRREYVSSFSKMQHLRCIEHAARRLLIPYIKHLHAHHEEGGGFPPRRGTQSKREGSADSRNKIVPLEGASLMQV